MDLTNSNKPSTTQAATTAPSSSSQAKPDESSTASSSTRREMPPIGAMAGRRNAASLPANMVLFTNLCNRLEVDTATKLCGRAVLERLQAMQLVAESVDGRVDGSRIWLACCVFIASAFGDVAPVPFEAEGQRLKLSRLLECTGVTVNDLFKNVETALDISAPCLRRAAEGKLSEKEVNEAVEEIKRKVRAGKYLFVVMSVCFGKFQLLWDVSRNFVEFDSPEEATRCENEYAYAWLLLVISKQRIFGDGHLALVPLYNLLVAVIGFIRFRHLEKYSEPLAKLAGFAKVENQEIGSMSKQVQEVFSALVSEGVQSNISKTSSLSRTLAAENHDKLSKYYVSRHVRTVCDFDERIFLDSQLRGQVVATPTKRPNRQQAAPNLNARAVPGSVNVKEAKQSRRQLFADDLKAASLSTQANYGRAYSSKLDDLQTENPLLRTPSKSSSHTFASPARRAKTTPLTQMTPVSSAMEASNWLRRELQDAPKTPSEHLRKRFFGSTGNDLEARLALKVRQFEKVIEKTVENSRRVPKLSLSEDSSNHPVRNLSERQQNPALRSWLDMVVKLFYRTLEAIMRGENERIGIEACTQLLKHEMFVRSVYMLCLETISRSKELYQLVYPVSRKLIQVPPLDLLKIFDCFVKYIPSLPRVLRKHLSAIEDSIIEEEIWKTKFLPYTIETIRIESQREKEEKLKNILLQKVFGLAQERLRSLCRGLFSEGSISVLYQDALQTLQLTVVKYPDVLKDRHLDHVIMCSIYSSAKVKQVKPDVSFKRIHSVLNSLRPQEPHAYNRVIRDISMRSSRRTSTSTSSASTRTCTMPPTPPVPYRQQSKSDIISYYNHVFLPRIKRSLLEKKSVKDLRLASAAAPPSPVVTTSKTRAPGTPQAAASIAAIASSQAEAWKDSPMRNSPPLRVKNSNVFVSPRRQRKETSKWMTPRTRALYAFGESPSSDLRLINRALRGSRSSRLRKGPSLDDDGDERLENSAKRARIDRIENLLSTRK